VKTNRPLGSLLVSCPIKSQYFTVKEVGRSSFRTPCATPSSPSLFFVKEENLIAMYNPEGGREGDSVKFWIAWLARDRQVRVALYLSYTDSASCHCPIRRLQFEVPFASDVMLSGTAWLKGSICAEQREEDDDESGKRTAVLHLLLGKYPLAWAWDLR